MSEKIRYFIELSYNGTNYHGWQIQPNAITVQECLDSSLSTVLRQKIETVGCGRTDTGVHARQFYAHFDLEVQPEEKRPADSLPIEKDSFLRRINAILPKDIAVKDLLTVNADAHARFDASLRSYEYHVHFTKDPFLHGLSWQIKDTPDVQAMNLAARLLFEYTDFSCFSKSNTQVFTNNCKIFRAEWVETAGGLIFHISADRFLRNMVRAIVGTLMLVGTRKIAPVDLHQIISSKNRSNAGTSVPASGLYLTKVKYPFL